MTGKIFPPNIIVIFFFILHAAFLLIWRGFLLTELVFEWKQNILFDVLNMWLEKQQFVNDAFVYCSNSPFFPFLFSWLQIFNFCSLLFFCLPLLLSGSLQIIMLILLHFLLSCIRRLFFMVVFLSPHLLSTGNSLVWLSSIMSIFTFIFSGVDTWQPPLVFYLELSFLFKFLSNFKLESLFFSVHSELQ